ncbi:MAG: YeeE/YedE thiosulfate transporter family protein [Terracidiphilus sp.]|nr:YeeE/YedE thiosulfate transporter family protein [Terracidiphilus sp.]
MTQPALTQFDGCGAAGEEAQELRPALLPVYLILGVLFGIVLTRAEVLSWFRIQEMFHFQSFRMYGIIGSAVVTAALSLALLKQLNIRSVNGEPIAVPPKTLGSGVRYAAGGTIFGVGWALTGACPGPVVALIGNGVSVMLVALFSALAGTWIYGWLKPHLPH